MNQKKIKIVHIINSLEAGGAETMLCNLLVRTDRDRFEPSVVSLIDNLSAAGPVHDAGIPLATMGIKPGVPDPRGFGRLIWRLNRLQPDIVQTWMDHSNLIGGLACLFSSSAPVIWGVHHSDHVRGLTKRTTLWTVSTCARLSRRLPARVVCCSERSREMYMHHGFAAEKIEVIPNGIDTEAFRPDPAARAEIRREMALAPEALVVGLVARYDVLKDHATFLHAAAILSKVVPDARFILCGRGVDASNTALASAVKNAGLTDRVSLLGHRHDVPRIQAAFDVATSSSISEAFPLVIGEAMASGVPCVVTDVGDSARIVGNEGRVVPPRNPQALAQACHELLALPPADRVALGQAGRRRIQELFDLGVITNRYEALYQRIKPPPLVRGDLGGDDRGKIAGRWWKVDATASPGSSEVPGCEPRIS